jgi:hypothetical protein
MRASNPQTWNLYVYVGNDPINQIDPTGLCRKALMRVTVYVGEDGSHGPPVPEDPSDFDLSEECPFLSQLLGGLLDNAIGIGGAFGLGQLFGEGLPSELAEEAVSVPAKIAKRPMFKQSAPSQQLETGEPSFLSKLGQCASDQLGITDLLALGAIAAGQPIPGTKPFVTPGSSRGTSMAGKGADWIFGDARLPTRLPSIVGGPGTGRRLAIRGTKSVARFAGRAVPIVGWAILAYDAASIAVCTAR